MLSLTKQIQELKDRKAQYQEAIRAYTIGELKLPIEDFNNLKLENDLTTVKLQTLTTLKAELLAEAEKLRQPLSLEKKGVGDQRKPIEGNKFVVMRTDGKDISGKKYLVVCTDEPYAGQVADLIEFHERGKGTWHSDDSMRDVIGLTDKEKQAIIKWIEERVGKE